MRPLLAKASCWAGTRLPEMPLHAAAWSKPFAEEAETGLGYYLVTSLARGNDKKISAFRAWIRKEMKPVGGG
jgi:hypothetical protein